MLEDQKKLRFLLLTLACLVLPHGLHLHWSHTLLFTGFWSWRWFGIGRPYLLPSGNWLPILTLTAASVVIVSQRGIIDLTTSTGLFVAGLGLKLMELKSERDLYFVAFLGWFVALTQFLYDQSLSMALYAFTAAALLTGVLVQFNGAVCLPWRALAQAVIGLLGPALPVAVGLFLFFPRPHGGFIRLSLDSSAKTGLAEILEPGAIAHLSTSKEVAFRVDFEGELPPPEERYFRAQVFWFFDGRRWLPQPAMQQPLPRPPPGMGSSYRYHVTIEPHHRRWLVSLGFPASVPEGAYLTQEGLLTAQLPVEERLRYRLASLSRGASLCAPDCPPLSPSERRLALQLPEAPSGKVQALVDQLRPSSGRPQDFAKAVLNYFRDQGFRYTLSPGTLGERPIEEFLFDTRAGFCEHYASTFAYLMRVAGIPARIVGGYLGGFVNPRGRFLEVYQANAHAWVEIWIEGQGWVRFDPTAAVAPRYVEQVQNLAAPLSVAIPAASSSEAVEARDDIWRKLVRNGLIFWSNLDHRWHVWVLSYDRQAQLLLLTVLAERWPLLILAALLALLGLKVRSSGKADPLLQAYRAFLQHLSRLGLTKAAQETPMDFARRAATRVPAEAAWIYRITEAFIRGRYGRGSAPEAAQEIYRLLRERFLNRYAPSK